LEQKRRIMIGVNDFTVDEEVPIDILRIDPRLESEQVARVREVRRKRDQARCANALTHLRKAAAGSDNLMPYILEAVRAYATEGEIMNTLIDVFGIYTEQAVV
jgi:methylmalonyl-CoA mutase N-terminal domain/subunit